METKFHVLLVKNFIIKMLMEIVLILVQIKHGKEFQIGHVNHVLEIVKYVQMELIAKNVWIPFSYNQIDNHVYQTVIIIMNIMVI